MYLTEETVLAMGFKITNAHNHSITKNTGYSLSLDEHRYMYLNHNLENHLWDIQNIGASFKSGSLTTLVELIRYIAESNIDLGKTQFKRELNKLIKV